MYICILNHSINHAINYAISLMSLTMLLASCRVTICTICILNHSINHTINFVISLMSCYLPYVAFVFLIIPLTIPLTMLLASCYSPYLPLCCSWQGLWRRSHPDPFPSLAEHEPNIVCGHSNWERHNPGTHGRIPYSSLLPCSSCYNHEGVGSCGNSRWW